jgi:hypothetical protein
MEGGIFSGLGWSRMFFLVGLYPLRDFCAYNHISDFMGSGARGRSGIGNSVIFLYPVIHLPTELQILKFRAHFLSYVISIIQEPIL